MKRGALKRSMAYCVPSKTDYLAQSTVLSPPACATLHPKPLSPISEALTTWLSPSTYSLPACSSSFSNQVVFLLDASCLSISRPIGMLLPSCHEIVCTMKQSDCKTNTLSRLFFFVATETMIIKSFCRMHFLCTHPACMWSLVPWKDKLSAAQKGTRPCESAEQFI